jgi:hypothetical protein
MRDAEWRHVDGRGAVCVALDDFEGERKFEQLGVNPFVLRPGEPMAMYHWEADQEAFLGRSSADHRRRGAATAGVGLRAMPTEGHDGWGGRVCPFPRREPTAYRDGWLPE